MNQKRDIELIIPDVLGCQEEKDKKNLNFLKENDKAFSWKELGEYQNLAALLALNLEIVRPSNYPKQITLRNLNRIIFGKEDVNHTEKFVLVKAKSEASLEKKNVDWGSLAAQETSKNTRSGFEEVKRSKSSGNLIFTQAEEDELIVENLEPEQEILDNSNYKTSNEKSSPSLKKYVAISVVLFLVIVSIVSYMFIFNQSPSEQIATVNKMVDAPDEVVEEFIYDSLKDFGKQVDVADLEQPETNQDVQQLTEVVVTDNKKKEKSLLPTAPPKLPDPIETPIENVKETVNEITNDETSLNEEISSTPPPKEISAEVEEPTFFVAVEEMPQPIGGLEGIQQKISYPEIAKRAGVEGKVYVRAYVDENGNVVNAEVVKGIGGGCDEAALEAVLKTKFSPGKQRGKPIKVQVTVPILFRL